MHNDLNDNSGRVRCRELLIKNLRNFGRTQHYTPEEADEKMCDKIPLLRFRVLTMDRTILVTSSCIIILARYSSLR